MSRAHLLALATTLLACQSIRTIIGEEADVRNRERLKRVLNENTLETILERRQDIAPPVLVKGTQLQGQNIIAAAQTSVDDSERHNKAQNEMKQSEQMLETNLAREKLPMEEDLMQLQDVLRHHEQVILNVDALGDNLVREKQMALDNANQFQGHKTFDAQTLIKEDELTKKAGIGKSPKSHNLDGSEVVREKRQIPSESQSPELNDRMFIDGGDILNRIESAERSNELGNRMAEPQPFRGRHMGKKPRGEGRKRGKGSRKRRGKGKIGHIGNGKRKHRGKVKRRHRGKGKRRHRGNGTERYIGKRKHIGIGKREHIGNGKRKHRGIGTGRNKGKRKPRGKGKRVHRGKGKRSPTGNIKSKHRGKGKRRHRGNQTERNKGKRKHRGKGKREHGRKGNRRPTGNIKRKKGRNKDKTRKNKRKHGCKREGNSKVGDDYTAGNDYGLPKFDDWFAPQGHNAGYLQGLLSRSDKNEPTGGSCPRLETCLQKCLSGEEYEHPAIADRISVSARGEPVLKDREQSIFKTPNQNVELRRELGFEESDEEKPKKSGGPIMTEQPSIFKTPNQNVELREELDEGLGHEINERTEEQYDSDEASEEDNFISAEGVRHGYDDEEFRDYYEEGLYNGGYVETVK